MRFLTKTKRIVGLALASIVSLSCLVSCGKKQEEKAEPVKKFEFTKGVHDLTAPEKSGYLAEDGKTDYTVVLPQNVDSNLILADSEIRYFFQEATGATLKSVIEDGTGFTHDDNAKYISIGNTKMFESANIDLKSDVLGTQGLRIVTKGNTVYINGGTTRGA